MVDHVFTRGFQGQVLIGTPKVEFELYMKSAVAEAKLTAYENRFFFTIGGETTNYDAVIYSLANSGTSNVVYSTGYTACLPAGYHSEIRKAAAAMKEKRLGGVCIWTIDKTSSADSYISDGTSSIVTNKPGKIADINGVRSAFAVPGYALVPALLPATWDCDCNYSSGGCKVPIPAPPGKSCKCKYEGAWTCSDSNANCPPGTSSLPKCVLPDKSFDSCMLGQGDCGGYPNSNDCDCDYSSGGCKISTVAPRYYACKCSYKGAWTCGGSVVNCDPANALCREPTNSHASCNLGGGDCGGY